MYMCMFFTDIWESDVPHYSLAFKISPGYEAIVTHMNKWISNHPINGSSSHDVALKFSGYVKNWHVVGQLEMHLFTCATTDFQLSVQGL